MSRHSVALAQAVFLHAIDERLPAQVQVAGSVGLISLELLQR